MIKYIYRKVCIFGHFEQFPNKNAALPLGGRKQFVVNIAIFEHINIPPIRQICGVFPAVSETEIVLPQTAQGKM